jgi:uncharacterized protein YceH (UPF0502 family)
MAAIELDPIEQRVIGSLLEKERTVPDAYPMTLNAVRTACNQTSGRDPVMALGAFEVQAGLDRLRGQGLTRVLHPSHGARTPKHRQVLDEVLSLEPPERAVLTLLLLRGPQTPGELRSRAERLHDFESLAQVQAALHLLSVRADPLVEEIPRRPGQKEARWVHRLGPVDASVGPEEEADVGRSVDVLAGGAAARDERVVASYDAVATAYADELLDELDRKPFDRWLLERVAGLAEGGSVADVGCGPGQVAAHLALAGAEVTGIDLSPGMVDEARRRFPELRFEVGDLTALAPGSWAAITAWYSLVHLAPQELPGAIDALVRAVRPGGWLALALHEGDAGHHLDEWWGHAVDIDFSFHRRADVLGAVGATGLEAVEWYLRGPSSPTEAQTNRLYVLGRRPAA